MKKEIKGFLFDFNGTLFFDSRMQLVALNHCFRDKGLPEKPDSYLVANVFGRTNRQIYLEQCDPNGSEADIAAFDKIKEDYYMQACLDHPEIMHLVEGAPALLEALKERNIPYCLATGSPRQNMDFYMEHLDLGRWFSYEKNIVYTDGSFVGKPAPDIYRLAAAKIGVAPGNCVVFEDGPSGLTAADAAGVETKVAIWEEGFVSPLSGGLKADLLLHDLKDTSGILSRLGIV